ncbi:MAG: hypothetical protein M1833_000706 [Piccolia ochrophora]|nr:MAG: hypothetical protein M1833_000706 [Piccolia ochrophora]
MVKIEKEFIAVGGNRHPSAADWDPSSGLVAFASDRNIALWDPLDEGAEGIKALLVGHDDQVNAVKFLRQIATREILLISGSVDKTLRIWTVEPSCPTKSVVQSVLTGHEGSINAIAVTPGNTTFVSGSSDAVVKVWKIEYTADENYAVCLVQTLLLTPRFFPLALALHPLTDSCFPLALAVAGTKNVIQIFVSGESRDTSEFKLQATLTGHEGWIRALDFTREGDGPSSDLLLASASQDKYIRLWRLHEGEDLPTASSASSDPALGSIGKSLSNKAHRIRSGAVSYSITFEALLLGHEDWIYSASWRSPLEKLQLLSASADNSLSIWEADERTGVWICTTRLGEISSQKGATTATGSSGGFWVGIWSPDGRSVVTLGRTGTWRLWSHDEEHDQWTQRTAVGGHTKAVTGIQWNPDGHYLLSTSSDQTTRLYAEWHRGDHRSWHEFARPQIHGYDLNCIDTIGPSRFISGADEKLLRVFEEPQAIAVLLERLCNIERAADQSVSDAANIPMLGLSNKAIQTANDDESSVDVGGDQREAVDPASVVRKSTLDLWHPPFEDHLARHTLWPETEKLYGHGYEISAVASSNDGRLVATACRASSIDHAVIRLFETGEWLEVKPPLTAHSLTVTALQFSKDDRYLLSVGRDRMWTVFERQQENDTKYTLVATSPKGHSRMILDAAWAPAGAGLTFATAGRDKTGKVWHASQTSGKPDFVCRATITADSAVTAIDFCPEVQEGLLHLAVGTEGAALRVCSLNISDLIVLRSYSFEQSVAPSRSIRQLRWRPRRYPSVEMNGVDEDDHTKSEAWQLAVASEDSSLRIYGIHGLGS